MSAGAVMLGLYRGQRVDVAIKVLLIQFSEKKS